MSSKSVFIVIPDHDIRVNLRRILETAGHFVVSAGSGGEAFLALENMSVPAIVFASSNVYMLGGEAFTTAFRAHEKYSKTPIVQVTPPNDKISEACLVLVSPFSDHQVIACLALCL